MVILLTSWSSVIGHHSIALILFVFFLFYFWIGAVTDKLIHNTRHTVEYATTCHLDDAFGREGTFIFVSAKMTLSFLYFFSDYKNAVFPLPLEPRLISSNCLSKYFHYDFSCCCCCCCVSCSPFEPLVTTLSVTTEQQKHVESWRCWSGISDSMDPKPEREWGQLASLHLVCLTRSPCNLYSACAVCVCTSTALLQDKNWQWIHRANFPALCRWIRLLHF